MHELVAVDDADCAAHDTNAEHHAKDFPSAKMIGAHGVGDHAHHGQKLDRHPNLSEQFVPKELIVCGFEIGVVGV